MTTREFLEQHLYLRELLDRFKKPITSNWALFDAELGYRGGPCVCRDGIDESNTRYQYEATGERKRIHYADQKCRINTYGNSMTQCHQVSDGETWQEYLAAHLGEPVRNFGMGGYGVYQAYRRMLREEKTGHAAEYIILNIYPDDHRRSIYKCRSIHCNLLPRIAKDFTTTASGYMFHANPWCHLRINLDTGQFEERENPFPTLESLYRLTDRAFFVAEFENDLDIQLLLASQRVSDVNLGVLKRLADVLEVNVDFASPEALAHSAKELLDAYALRSSMYILPKIKAYAKATGKKLLVLGSALKNQVVDGCKGVSRFDQAFITFLKENEFLFSDIVDQHVEECRRLGCAPEEYAKLYFIGHYSPRGNHFFAYAMKNIIKDWLDPKPPAYLKDLPSQKSLAATFG